MRLKPQDRKAEILTAAIKVAGRPGGWSTLTRESVANEAGCAVGLVSRYFGTMACFKRAIMRAAVNDRDLSIIAQGLATRDVNAIKADADLKAQALATLAN